jgi:DNA-binding phage protein
MGKISPTIKVIKAEMERQEVGVHEVAGAVGIAASTLYRILDGEFVPNFQIVEDLVKVLKLRLVVK